MRSLNPRQQDFVLALYATGGRSYTEAAIAAGYGSNSGTLDKNVAAVTGSRLVHTAAVQAAIQEMATGMMGASVPIAVIALRDMAMDPTNPKRLNAVQALLDRTGHHAKTEHKVQVIHEDKAEVDRQIAELARQIGADPKTLLGRDYVDVPFTEVGEGNMNGLEDL